MSLMFEVILTPTVDIEKDDGCMFNYNTLETVINPESRKRTFKILP